MVEPRRWRRRVVAAAVGLVLAAVMSEALLRWLHPRVEALGALLYQPTAATRFDHVRTLPELLELSPVGFSPFTVHSGFVLNSKGLRTVEYTPRPPAGTTRVLVLGDSFAFACGGVAHDEHWPTLVEAGLAAATGRSMEVLRFGVPGVGPAFLLRLFELEGAHLGADLVILSLFVGNDFIDHQDAAVTGLLARQGRREWLAHHSYLVRLVGHGARALTGVEERPPRPRRVDPPGGRVVAEAANREPQRPTFTQAAYAELESRRMSLCAVDRRHALDRLVAAVTADVARLAREVEASGARLLVVVIPDEFQVDREVAARARRVTGESADRFDLDAPQARLGEELRRHGVPWLDLLPALRANLDLRPYRPRDSHWSPAGNRLAADLIVDRVVASGVFGDRRVPGADRNRSPAPPFLPGAAER